MKTEKMESDGQALSKLLEMLITKQAESDAKNRELIERLAKERPAIMTGVDRVDRADRIDLTKETNATYPKMAEQENMSTYLAKLEYSFGMYKTSDARKCPILWSHLTPSACDKLMASGPIPGESCDSLKVKLLREYLVGYAKAATEALRVTNPEISIRETLKQKDEMLAIVAESATTIAEALSCVSRMIVCSHLSESLVYELDAQVPENHHTFHRKCEEWKDRQIPGTCITKSVKKELEKSSMYKSPEKFKCYTCGKPGHTSKYCRLNRPAQPQPDTPEKKPIVCYNCREVGLRLLHVPNPKAISQGRKKSNC